MLQIKFSVHSAALQAQYSAQILSSCSLQHTAITLPHSLPNTFPCLQPSFTRRTIGHCLEVFTPVSHHPPSPSQYTTTSLYSYSSRVLRGCVPQSLVALSLSLALIRKTVVCFPQKITCRELLDPASGPTRPDPTPRCNRTDLVNSSPTGTASNRRKTPSGSEELLARETNNRP